MKKLMIAILSCAVLLSGCGSTGISQEEYDKVVAERDKIQEDYERLKEFHDGMMNDYAALQASVAIDEITGESDGKTEEAQEEDKSETLLYEDANVKIYFKGISEEGVEFWVENLTDLNITIQADTVSINRISTDDIMMSDDVAPQSTGKVVARCEGFEEIMTVVTVGGQLRIVDFSKTWEPYYYDVKIVNVEIE